MKAPANTAAKKVQEILAAYEITEHLKVDEITGYVRRGSQSINYDSIVRVTHFSPPQDVTKKLRIEIKRDSYDNQSHARISVWSTATESWSMVASLTVQDSRIFKAINPYEEDPGLVSAERRMKLIAGNLINTAAEVIF